MITPEKIDGILNRFDAELKGIENVMINRLRKVVLSKLTDNELIDFFAQIDLFQEISNSGYQAAINNLQADYVKVMNEIVKQAKAKGLDRVTGVGLANLDTLIQSDLNQVLRSGAFVSEQLRSGLLRAFIQGIPRKQIANEILPSLQAQIPFNPIWLKTAINQSLTNFQNTTIAAVFEDAPQTKFELIHIFDKDTRPLCKHAIDNMKKYPDGLTIEQINDGKLYDGYSKRSKSEPDNYTFENRGGFNCRGYWKLLEISG